MSVNTYIRTLSKKWFLEPLWRFSLTPSSSTNTHRFWLVFFWYWSGPLHFMDWSLTKLCVEYLWSFRQALKPGNLIYETKPLEFLRQFPPSTTPTIWVSSQENSSTKQNHFWNLFISRVELRQIRDLNCVWNLGGVSTDFTITEKAMFSSLNIHLDWIPA